MWAMPELSSSAAGTCRAGRVPRELAGYCLAWSDEFDGAAGSPPDPSVWRPEIGGHGWGNKELQFYTGDSQNACLDGAGHLTIVVRRVDPRVSGHRHEGCDYTSARLISKDRMALPGGLLQARIQLPGGRGIWPGFWMLGQNIDEVGWPQCGEIDVMENFGADPRVVHGTVHGPGYSGRAGITASHQAGSDLSGGFHVYSIAREPGRIRWYLDGELYHTVTPAELSGKPWVFDHDFFLLLNVAVGGTLSQAPGSSVTFPRTMLIDYIRFYHPPPGRIARSRGGTDQPYRDLAWRDRGVSGCA
jgi:beta-glucanase (GH16 family)